MEEKVSQSENRARLPLSFWYSVGACLFAVGLLLVRGEDKLVNCGIVS